MHIVNGKYMNTILSLDLGTSSVGWALFEGDGKGLPTSLIDLGVRHFEEVTDAKSKVTLNSKRRGARGFRRNLRRRRQRLDLLLRLMRGAGLVEAYQNPFAQSENQPHEPYRLRAKAVEERVELPELGRALYHLARRRGFKSNRGAKLASLKIAIGQDDLTDEGTDETLSADEKRERSRLLAGIRTLEEALNGKTLGQYFYEQINSANKVRGRHTSRSQYENEFERIWSKQAEYYPDTLTPSLRAEIHQAIFWQRPLKLQKYLKAPCSLEPARKVAERGQLVAQRFRYWQDLANLRFENGTETRTLTVDEKLSLANRLDEVSEMTWAGIKRYLQMEKGWTANLERSKAKALKGNSTRSRIERALSQDPNSKFKWASLPDDKQEQLVEMLLTIRDRGACYKALKSTFPSLSDNQRYQLAVLELEGGCASLSSRAMNRILLQMQEGKTRAEAQEAVGYKAWNPNVVTCDRLQSPPDRRQITSPRVRKALGQVRLVVNKLISVYGRPAVVRIELARDLSLTKKERADVDQANKRRQAENERVLKALRGMGISEPSYTEVVWFKLAEQCNWICPYSGAAIGQSADSMSLFDIEHIVPFGLCADGSFNNLTLCERTLNQLKGSKTPYQAFGGDPQRWNEICARVQNWANGDGVNGKRRRFLSERDPDADQMVARQLNETRYICRAAADYLKPVCENVESTKGQATSMICKRWGLMTAIPGNKDGDKTRSDLRHHAVDAAAIAFTTRSVFQSLTRLRKVRPFSQDEVGPAPEWLWAQLRTQLESMVVSHETTRRISGALHEETALGRIGEGHYHVRKRLDKLTDKQLDDLVDEGLKRALKALPDRKQAVIAGPLGDGLEFCGTIARRARVRIIKQDRFVAGLPPSKPVKYFATGSNHHVAIFEDGEGNRIGRFVSMIEAATRARQKKPIVDVTPPLPGYEFVMWAAKNDLLLVEGELYRVDTIDTRGNRLIMRSHIAAGEAASSEPLRRAISQLSAVKLQVDAIGKVTELPRGSL